MRLETERLLIRPLKRTDCSDMYEYTSDFEVANRAGWVSHLTIKQTKNFVRGLRQKKETHGIILKTENKLIGTISLYKENFRRNHFTLELGYSLNRHYWGQGIIPEACQRVISYCFEETICEVIMALCEPANTNSIQVLEKCGFKEEGLLRDFTTNPLKQRISVKAYSLLKKEYERKELPWQKL
ncbi:MAG: GNAT family N-acetyltransferase [Erysipelotrichales bacterium]|nr:GNAT family N-acetyltransferase [Erysipelotrichales bacterium]